MAFWKRQKSKKAEPVFRGPDQSDPQTFIRSFCFDYKEWNDYCIQISDSTASTVKSKTTNLLSAFYSVFIGAYAVPQIKLQLISYGSNATFDPERLTFGSVDIKEHQIRQQFFIKSTHSHDKDEYVAELIRDEAGEMQLQQIFYIDPFPEDYAEDETPMLPCL